MDIVINPDVTGLAPRLLELYSEVAEIPGGIIRRKEEIDDAYISGFLSNATKNGLILTAVDEGKLVGEIHAYTPDIYAFQHILTDLTIVVAPDHQGKGVGRKLFGEFLRTVREKYPHILRIELYVREHNTRNVAFYRSLGFVNEGRQEHKIFKSGAEPETPLHMAWFNPGYFVRSY